MSSLVDVILALGSLSGLAALANALIGRRKVIADSKKVTTDASAQIAETALTLIEPLRTQVEELQEKVVVLQTTVNEQDCRLKRMAMVLQRHTRRIEYLMQGINQLISQLVQAGITPCWQPEEWADDERKN